MSVPESISPQRGHGESSLSFRGRVGGSDGDEFGCAQGEGRHRRVGSCRAFKESEEDSWEIQLNVTNTFVDALWSSFETPHRPRVL